MSGFKKSEHNGGKFVNFSKGKVVGMLNGEKISIDSYSGYILSVDLIDDKYNDKEYKKIVLEMLDDDGIKRLVSFSMENGYGVAFCSILPNIDLKKEVTLTPTYDAIENTNPVKYKGGLIISQQGIDGKQVALKWFYSSKAKKQLPPPVELLNKKKEKIGLDYSDRNEFCEKLINGWYEVVKANYEKNFSTIELTGKSEKAGVDNAEAVDDLPF